MKDAQKWNLKVHGSLSDVYAKVIIMNNCIKVLVEKDGLSSFQESMAIGRQVLEKKLAVYENKLRTYEKERGIDSQTFLMRFNNGELGDGQDLLKWEHLATVAALLRKKLLDINSLRYEY